MTYSVIAFDAEPGAYAVGVQSHWFNVRRIVPWVRSGVGAVATQAMADPAYGWRGLDAMAAGEDAETALRRLLEADPASEVRQVAFVDAAGTVAVHTGSRCVRFAGHHVGDGWAVLGNMLSSAEVVPAMAAAYATATGDLADRVVAVLAAAEAAGGDVRGSQSAAIRVVPGGTDPEEDMEAGIDLSVVDHHDPIGELRRLVGLDRSYRELDRGGTAAEAGDEAAALDHLRAANGIAHGEEVDFWRAVTLAELGHVAPALEILATVVAAAPRFGELLERLGEVDAVAPELLAVLSETPDAP